MQHAEAPRSYNCLGLPLGGRKCVLLEATALQFCCHSFQMASAVFL